MTALETQNDHQVESTNQFQELLSQDLQRISLLYFWGARAVPSFIVLRGHTLLARITGADAAALTEVIAKYVSPAGNGGAALPLSQTDKAPPLPYRTRRSSISAYIGS
ncbi:hypothetical protein EI94DRAFT_1799708 [Lactarius quietus]|nr:hypothetical protein EI94DRAFT_1799708 [Lactarius quietus]